MMVFSARANVAIGMTMGLSGLWLFSVPRLVSNSAFAVFVVLFTGAVGVSYLTWRDTELALSSRRAASDGTRK